MSSAVLEGLDDCVLPFSVEPLDIRGRAVRLGPAIDAIIARHGYPDRVARVLAEAAALTALLGASLKFSGRLQLQTKTDGAIGMIVVDFDAPGSLRAFARFDADKLSQYGRKASSGALIGRGHLALTIDQGPDKARYQGVVALEGQNLEEAAHQYFRQSEQIPTRIRLAVAEELVDEAGRPAHSFRSGGVLVQFLPAAPERMRSPELPPGDAPEGISAPPVEDEDDAWVEARALMDTIQDYELVDPAVSSERLLYRLFHERGVRVFNAQPLEESCRCSQPRVVGMIKSFSSEERREMRKDGRIIVTCEFCSRVYDFDADEIETQIDDDKDEIS